MTDLTARLEEASEGSREVACPRCHEQCGWCSDYRWMHGTMSLPGTRLKCTVPGMQPDPVCTVCAGDRRVMMTTRYSPIPKPTTAAPSNSVGTTAGRAPNPPQTPPCMEKDQ